MEMNKLENSKFKWSLIKGNKKEKEKSKGVKRKIAKESRKKMKKKD